MLDFPFKLYLTETYDCSYVDGRKASSQVVVPVHLVDTQVYSKLVHQRFRRSGVMTYRPCCQGCDACVSLRIPVARFKPNKSQRRTWRKWLEQLQVQKLNLQFSDEHYDLYQAYQQKRHAGGNMEHDSQQQFEQFLLRSGVQTYLLEYRLNSMDYGQKGELKMVSVIDVLRDGLSAVYTFYDPADDRASYGTYGILWQIAYAKALMLPYVYLGYWVKECPKMAYKTSFQPYELLTAQGWTQG